MTANAKRLSCPRSLLLRGIIVLLQFLAAGLIIGVLRELPSKLNEPDLLLRFFILFTPLVLLGLVALASVRCGWLCWRERSEANIRNVVGTAFLFGGLALWALFLGTIGKDVRESGRVAESGLLFGFMLALAVIYWFLVRHFLRVEGLEAPPWRCSISNLPLLLLALQLFNFSNEFAQWWQDGQLRDGFPNGTAHSLAGISPVVLTIGFYALGTWLLAGKRNSEAASPEAVKASS